MDALFVCIANNIKLLTTIVSYGIDINIFILSNATCDIMIRMEEKCYALLLAKKLAQDGDEKSSKRIETLLLRKNNGSAITDALVAPPVD